MDSFTTIREAFYFFVSSWIGIVYAAVSKKRENKKILNTRGGSVRVPLSTRTRGGLSRTQHATLKNAAAYIRSEKTLNTCIRLCNCKGKHTYSPVVTGVWLHPLPFFHFSRVQCIIFGYLTVVYWALRLSTKAFSRSLVSYMLLAILRETKKKHKLHLMSDAYFYFWVSTPSTHNGNLSKQIFQSVCYLQWFVLTKMSKNFQIRANAASVLLESYHVYVVKFHVSET